MLNCFLISPTPGLCLALQGMCAELGEVFIYKALDSYPPPMELGRFLNVVDPEVMLLEIGPMDEAMKVAAYVHDHRPQTVVIGFTRQRDRARFALAATLGMGEILVAPFTLEDLRQALWRSFRQRPLPVFPNLMAFLPSKPGSGASTIAVNLAGLLANQAGQNLLLIDGDRHAGVLATLLNVEPKHTVLDTLKTSHELDDGTWTYRKFQVRGFDLLAMPPRPEMTELPPWCYHRLLHFVQSRYDRVVIDLPHVTEAEQDSFIRQAGSVFVVCTPEPAALLLARRRMEELRQFGVEPNRIHLVLNRRLEQDREAQEIERFLEAPLYAVLPYDYASVRKAGLTGSLVTEKSELGVAFNWMAHKLVGLPVPELPVGASHGGLRGLFRRRQVEAV
jgi:pilus assembly protein CpaE